MEQEIWKDIIGCEGKYQVSNFGRVKSLPKMRRTPTNLMYLTKDKIMSIQDDGRGYIFIGLMYRTPPHPKRPKIHKLVAECFLENPNNYKEINHKNGIKSDNRVENLEWCTRSHNIRHAVSSGLQKAPRGATSLKSKIVLDTQTGIFYDCAREAAEAFNMNHFTLCHKLSGKNKKNNTSLIYA